MKVALRVKVWSDVSALIEATSPFRAPHAYLTLEP